MINLWINNKYKWKNNKKWNNKKNNYLDKWKIDKCKNQWYLQSKKIIIWVIKKQISRNNNIKFKCLNKLYSQFFIMHINKFNNNKNIKFNLKILCLIRNNLKIKFLKNIKNPMFFKKWYKIIKKNTKKENWKKRKKDKMQLS